MHQTFYVDVDEEVNSVISRLRKSTSQYNILAVAQQGLILQSSVSLRLIKKEMDALKKKVMIVTQDERGLAMAKKVGFPVKKTMEEVKKAGDSTSDQVDDFPQNSEVVDAKKDEDNKELDINEKNRLRNLGDSDYVAVEESTIRKPIVKEKKKNEEVRGIGLGTGELEKDGFSDLFAENSMEDRAPVKDKIAPRGAKKILWAFVLIVAVVLAGILTYLFLPKAEIDIVPKKIQKNINFTVKASENNQEDDSLSDTIKLNSVLIEIDDVFSGTFAATGEKSSATKKARGKIIISNNFSEASQILVATTRFLSEDGKLFRLTKSVTVPGMKIEDGKKVAGEIEAEVVADQSGEEYNIEPTTFKIPGFEGGPKYEKFSGKSEEKMKGGGEGSSDLKTISQEDINKAEKESLEKIKAQLAEKIREKAGDENVFAEELIEYEVLDSASFPELGAIADDFEYQIKARAKYLTFSEKDLDEKINEYIVENVVDQGFPVKIVGFDKKYGKANSNFSEKSTETKVTANIILEAELNTENIKEDLLGRNQEEVDEFIKIHPEIQKIDAMILPSFLASRIPKYSYRVEVNIVSSH